MSWDRQEVLKRLTEIEERAARITGPTYAQDDVEAFRAAAAADIPMMAKALRAVIAEPECPNCGLEQPIAYLVARALHLLE